VGWSISPSTPTPLKATLASSSTLADPLVARGSEAIWFSDIDPTTRIVIESDPNFVCGRILFVSRQNTRVEAKVSFLFQIYFSSQFIGSFRFMERDYRMNKVNDLMLFESVILHWQMTHNITGTREALVAAQKDGLVDFYNQLTSAGRNVGQMMLSNLEDYQTLFDVKFKKPPDFFDQQVTH